jgi:ubiquinone/menaquinone biosynthesis C-methylase UbiE
MMGAIFAILAILAAILVILLYQVTPLGNGGRARSQEWIHVTSNASLVHVGSNDSFASTKEGTQAAKFVLDFLKTNNPQSAKSALKTYDLLIPVENYGGEYTTLKWFVQTLLLSDKEREKILSDKFVANFYQFFTENDFARLKEYLERKYDIVKYSDRGTTSGEERKVVLEDTILFNNPTREDWEKTSKILKFIHLKPGQTVADIGSGPGYFSTKFSQMVGEKGKIYAIDTVQQHLDYINNYTKKSGINNIQTVKTEGDTIGFPENRQVDMAFMCSLYHNVYGMSKTDERNRFIESIYKAVNKDGTLIVIDNALVKDSELPYHGPYIAKELIIAQLKYYGFRYVKDEFPVPQRYVLMFKKDA